MMNPPLEQQLLAGIDERNDVISRQVARIEELEKALRKAMDLVESEYCSHGSPHSADNEQCYTQQFYAALKEQP